MDHAVFALLLAFGLFAGMLALLITGSRLAARRRARDPEAADAGQGAIDGAVFALLGLLIAFTFSGAADRFDQRRELIVQEANAIGTAWLRLELLAEPARAALRQGFRDYLDARLEAYRSVPDMDAVLAALSRATALQDQIWQQAVAACRVGGMPSAPILLLPALNEMIDITTTRTMAARFHPPSIIFIMLFALALAASLLAGYGMQGGTRSSRIHMLVFAATAAFAIYVILDLEYPRVGLIRVDAADQVLIDLRASMGG